jgi:hypothetical protein
VFTQDVSVKLLVEALKLSARTGSSELTPDVNELDLANRRKKVQEMLDSKEGKEHMQALNERLAEYQERRPLTQKAKEVRLLTQKAKEVIETKTRQQEEEPYIEPKITFLGAHAHGYQSSLGLRLGSTVKYYSSAEQTEPVEKSHSVENLMTLSRYNNADADSVVQPDVERTEQVEKLMSLSRYSTARKTDVPHIRDSSAKQIPVVLSTIPAMAPTTALNENTTSDQTSTSSTNHDKGSPVVSKGLVRGLLSLLSRPRTRSTTTQSKDLMEVIDDIEQNLNRFGFTVKQDLRIGSRNGNRFNVPIISINRMRNGEGEALVSLSAPARLQEVETQINDFLSTYAQTRYSKQSQAFNSWWLDHTRKVNDVFVSQRCSSHSI